MMKTIKNLMLLVMLVLTGMVYASGDVQNNQELWLEEKTQDYDYKKGVSFAPLVKETVLGSNVTISHNIFNTGLVRTKITKELVNNNIKITKETWTTTNPSYATWLNGALAIAVLGAIPYDIKVRKYNTLMPIRSLRRIQNVASIPADIVSAGVKDIGYEIDRLNNPYGCQRSPFLSSYFTLEYLPYRFYSFATDPLVATAVGGYAAYYLYQKYMASPKDEQKKETEEKIAE
jgi:hypothetical protein